MFFLSEYIYFISSYFKAILTQSKKGLIEKKHLMYLHFSDSTNYHLFHADKSMQNRALTVLVAVLIRVWVFVAGLGQSREGDQAPPNAISSCFPLLTTRN
jgi:hypothetical protein